jgi:hypothetical protein
MVFEGTGKGGDRHIHGNSQGGREAMVCEGEEGMSIDKRCGRISPTPLTCVFCIVWSTLFLSGRYVGIASMVIDFHV